MKADGKYQTYGKSSQGASGRSPYDNSSDYDTARDEATTSRRYRQWLNWEDNDRILSIFERILFIYKERT